MFKVVGPGSNESEDAFTKNWGKEPLVWMNPPFSLLDSVVDKIKNDGAQAILIMPQWEDQRYFEEVQPMILKKCVYSKGAKVFEQKEGAMPGIRWPIWAAFVNGTNDM